MGCSPSSQRWDCPWGEVFSLKWHRLHLELQESHSQAREVATLKSLMQMSRKPHEVREILPAAFKVLASSCQGGLTASCCSLVMGDFYCVP